MLQHTLHAFAVLDGRPMGFRFVVVNPFLTQASPGHVCVSVTDAARPILLHSGSGPELVPAPN